ncbi:MAG: hypothetical protein JJU02_06020 [Cryomorphaceae bacterium]|nr:hypothetical protein [Cryomorphaceae bacterium]
MTKNLFFIIIVLIASITAKAQYKNGISVDVLSIEKLTLEYDYFLYSKSLHHISLRAIVGTNIPFFDKFGAGMEILYGYGNNHRVEVGTGFYHFFEEILGVPENYKYVVFPFRLGYAYHAKNNPMFYRAGYMPVIARLYGSSSGNNFSFFSSISLSVGYRF